MNSWILRIHPLHDFRDFLEFGHFDNGYHFSDFPSKREIFEFLVIQPSLYFGTSIPIYTCLIVRKQNSAI